MKTEQVRSLTVEELKHKEGELREELFNLKFQNAIGKLENSSRLRQLRKDIARVLTVAKEKSSREG